MRFLLYDVFHAEHLLGNMDATRDITRDLLDAILDEAARLNEQLLAPLNQTGDQQGCSIADGKVTTPAGFPAAYRAFAEGGWVGLMGDPSYGGQGMPKMLSVLFEEMLFAANSSFALYPILTSGASLALFLHGNDSLKSAYLPNLYSGRWSATMCLTEPHAGSDLGIIKTRAVPDVDGSYRITGTKIFITAGEHDLSENIIHFVLAKLPDAPAGSHGISMFLVPKFKPDSAGNPGKANGVSCGSIEHKMGIKASATCVMNFEQAEGYLVGEVNKGLACMFTMMNYERLSMGLQGIGLAQSSYAVALEYARERLQGKSPMGSSGQKVADPIIVHPDVRRMLLTMKSNIMAGRALSIYLAGKLDIAKFHDSDSERQRASQLVDLLTPVAKAYCTDRGFEACVLGQQILGGHGYVAEWGLEQNVRDARIAQIYEGTNGIQAMDLMGRKTMRCNAALLDVFLEDINAFCDQHKQDTALATSLAILQDTCGTLRNVTQGILRRGASDPAEAGSASYAYMELLGLVSYCFMWCRILAAVQQRQRDGNPDRDYFEGLEATAQFFMLRLMPRHKSLAEEIASGSASLMTMKVQQF
jgi:alkylation response protein AidB-like acyl-CoA dehydrogenase